MGKLVRGVYAAVVTPRTADGQIDLKALRRWIRFLVEVGVEGFAINGATGELTLTSEDELRALLGAAVEAADGKAGVLAGVGAGVASGSIALGRIAHEAGTQGLLLPMPSFFAYAQDDLMAFCLRVADSVETPVLLYNLPQFTTGLEPETTLALLRACPNIVGIKDSSGSLDTVELLKRERPEACRIIGNDGALAQALRRGLADAVVSGVACVLPELMTALFASGYNGEPDPLLEEALNAFIAQLDTMPTPWALKVMAEARGITPAWFALPLSVRRQGQREALSQWLQQNLDAMWATRLAPQEA